MSALLQLVAALTPLFGAVVTARAGRPRGARRLAVLTASLALIAAVAAPLVLWWSGGATSWSDLLPAFVLTIGLTAVAMSPLVDVHRVTFARILVVTAATTSLMITRDPVVLAVAWIASAVPVWIELRERVSTRSSARTFAAYHLPSGLLVITGAMLESFGMVAAGALALAAGVFIREAMVPAHSWLPRFVEKAPMGLVVVFAAPQVGVYTHLVWLTAHLPQGFELSVAALGAVTVVAGAALGAVQQRPRRALGYLLMSQTALVAFGLETHSAVGLTGAVATWMVLGLAMSGLAMTMAAIQARRGELSLDRPSGTFRRTPLLASAYLLLGLASVGLPGTLGFVAEDLLVQGSVEHFPHLGFALIVGTAFNSVTIVRSFFGLFTGARDTHGEQDLTLRERAALTLVLGAVIVTGLWPSLALRQLHDADSAEVAVLEAR